ncbi:phospholipase B1, membrane-associated-like isoform X2 [Hydractinia symbiolongicarpus]|nr:phospholipase B1, membrane-associated-like isoform X2 [Hydractinia symbiolongicarpus]
MFLLALLVFCCINETGIVASPQNTNQTEWLWQLFKTNGMGDLENFYEFLNRVTHGEIFNISLRNHQLLKEMGYVDLQINKTEIPDFDCIVEKSKHYIKATSVHKLTPHDIDIVAAMGDSLTAGFGACAYTLIDLFVECRGISWSIGGDDDIHKHITLPNILKEYNSNLKGYAVGITPPLVAFPNEHLDVAVSGATSYGMLKQAKHLVEKMVLDSKYDFFGSWKVLTFFIGGNDLCSCCRSYKDYNVEYSPENYVKEVTAALDYLHDRVPKMFVNLINAPDVTILNDLRSLYCDLPHLIECKCGTVWGKKARNYTHFTAQKYHQLFRDLVESRKYDTRDDFTVVLQPFFDETIIPRKPNGKVDTTYFAPDCFHFSRKAHAASALALWNSMLEPVGSKSKEWHTGEYYRCPTKNKPYFYTMENSKGYGEKENAKTGKASIFQRMRECIVRLHTFFVGTSTARQHNCVTKGINNAQLNTPRANEYTLFLFILCFLCICFLMIKKYKTDENLDPK